MDVGCYNVSGSRLLGGEPERVWGEAWYGPSGTDWVFNGTLRFPGDVLATFDCATALAERDELEAIGSEGSLFLDDPWHCVHPVIELRRNDGVERIELEPVDSYRLELENLSDAIRGEAEPASRTGRRSRAGEGARSSSPLGDDRGAGFALAAARFHSFPRALAWGGRMSAHAAPAPTGPTFTIRGRPYPVLLPKLADPRLHLAAVIISLQIIGQVGFDFELSIAQILLSIGTLRRARGRDRDALPARHPLAGERDADRQRRRLRPARSRHGARRLVEPARLVDLRRDRRGLAALQIRDPLARRAHLQPVQHRSRPLLPRCSAGPAPRRSTSGGARCRPGSCSRSRSSSRAASLILRRLKLLRVALGFWVSFAVAIGVLALAGHTMTARWHLGPISGFQLWWVLVTSPEVLVFLFFMITDPKTAPRSPSGRLAYAVSLGLLAGVLIAPTTTEYAAKVALLGSLALVCLALPLLRLVPSPLDRAARRRRRDAGGRRSAAAMLVGERARRGRRLACRAARLLAADQDPPRAGRPDEARRPHGAADRPRPARGSKPTTGAGPLRVWLVQGVEQGPPTATVAAGRAQLSLAPNRGRALGAPLDGAEGAVETAPPREPVLRGVRLTNVAPAVGLDFRQGSFRYGDLEGEQAMMGGGVCWLDYNGDGWQDLFAVNSYSSADTAVGGARRAAAHAAVREPSRPFPQRDGESPRRPPGARRRLRRRGSERRRPARLIVTTTNGIKLLWNNGNGTFTEGARARRDDRVGLVHGRRRRGRERRRPPGRLRRRLHPPVRLGAELARRLPDEPRRRPRPPLPERRERPERPRALPRGRGAGRSRGVRLLARPRRRPSSTSTATAVRTCTSRTTRIRTSCTSTSRGRAERRPTRPGSASASRTAPRPRGWRIRTPAWASPSTAAAAARSTCSSPTRATSRRPRSPGRRVTRVLERAARLRPGARSDFAGWGDSFVDLRNSGRSDLVLATGGDPGHEPEEGRRAGEGGRAARRGGTQYGVATGVAPRLPR